MCLLPLSLGRLVTEPTEYSGSDLYAKSEKAIQILPGSLGMPALGDVSPHV